jgi:chemosensory pili system protein ChpA (sensor histidine kinase/response regulator)
MAIDSKVIMIVDDEESVLRTTQRLIARDSAFADYKIFTYEDPLQAVQEVQGKNPEAVISDYDMPSMTGDKVLQKIKGYSGEIKTILQTSRLADSQEIEELRRAGAMDAYIPKPTPDIKSIPTELKRLLGK